MTSSEYGMVVRADISRMFGTHWNLNGYWRGSLQSSTSSSAQTLQDSMNRTYLMRLTYINPNSPWNIGIGRLYLPWASSLETIDGGYVAHKLSAKTLLGAFGGSTPDPTAWDYNPQRKIFGGFFNAHGGSFESFHYSTTAGAGVNLLDWSLDRPFLFTENEFSFKRYFSLFHSMQIDRPTANPGTPAVGVGLGQSLFTLRVQPYRKISLDLTDTYFRDVPTYSSILVGTGLLDKYLYQGINGGARVDLPLRLVGYFSLGDSNTSNDKKDSLNEMVGASITRIWKIGVQADARYSKFDSSFATGTYKTLTLSRDLGERFRLNIQGGSTPTPLLWPLPAIPTSSTAWWTPISVRAFFCRACLPRSAGEPWTTTSGPPQSACDLITGLPRGGPHKRARLRRSLSKRSTRDRLPFIGLIASTFSRSVKPGAP